MADVNPGSGPAQARDNDGAAPKTPQRVGSAPSADWDEPNPEGEDGESAFKPLTREEAQALQARQPKLSPWTLVVWQLAAGAIMVALWGLLTLRGDRAGSALCGAVAAVVPSALMAWGMTRRTAMNASTALLSLMTWELIKIVLTIAILVAVVLWVPDLSWPALLSTMVVCLKANWLALLSQGRIRK